MVRWGPLATGSFFWSSVISSVLGRTLDQNRRLRAHVVGLKNDRCLLRGTAQQDLDFSVVLFHFNGAHDSGHPFLRQSADPDVDPISISRPCALQIPVIERI